MLGEITRSILNVNLKKDPRQIQHPTKDFKIELLVKIVIDFKLQTIFAKKSILDVSKVLSSPLITILFWLHGNACYQKKKSYVTFFLKLWLLLHSRDFTCSKLTVEALKTRARCKTCLKLIVRTPERHQLH